MLFACSLTVSAHRLDEYLQATLVSIGQNAICLQINLTPGVAVADQVLSLIDRNHDNSISTNEASAYSDLVKHDLTLHLDRQILELKLTASEFSTPADLRTGSGIIQLEFTAIPEALSSGPHTLTLENHHQATNSVYLFNAAHPRSAAVQITAQKRNDTQSTGEIGFTFHSRSHLPYALIVAAPFAVLLAFLSAFRSPLSGGNGAGER